VQSRRPIAQPYCPAVTFGRRLATALEQRGPLCVGVDPSPALLSAWGLTHDASGLAVLKPQVAFWETHGSVGYAALERFITLARERGFLVLADAKRGDIGSTSEAYARTWLDPASPLCVDAVTVTAYLGFGALDPFLAVAAQHDNGVIVVARSSNPEGAVVQSALTDEGSAVADHAADRDRPWKRTGSALRLRRRSDRRHHRGGALRHLSTRRPYPRSQLRRAGSDCRRLLPVVRHLPDGDSSRQRLPGHPSRWPEPGAARPGGARLAA